MTLLRYLLVLFAIYLVSGTGGGAEGQDASARADVALSRNENTLAARWILSDPAESVSFEGWVEPDERQRLWIPQGDDWLFDGHILAREDGAPFDSFELHLNPSDQIYDRRYVAILQIGERGWTVLTEGLSLEGHQSFIAADVDPEGEVFLADDVRLPSSQTIAATTGGFVYLGPEHQIAEDHATMIAGPDIPDWMRAKFAADIDAISQTLTERFEMPPEAPPVLVMSFREDERASFKGSALGRFIMLHVRGFELDRSNEDFIRRMTALALHEAVHVWIGQLYSSRENAEQSWLHEGAAEYISMRAWMDTDQLRADLEEKINQCKLALVRRPLIATRYGSRGRAPYDCGAIVQLIAESASLGNEGGDILAIWKDVFESASDGRTFDTALFRAAATAAGGDEFADRMGIFENAMDSGEWASFLKDLSEIGIFVVLLEPTDQHPEESYLAAAALGAL
ncbi:MAG: basic secretory family protein, partial [Henriciella sp.]|nr:basic secretory family protein [Henriciella sp.]